VNRPNLVSLDLSFNQIDNLKKLVSSFKNSYKLKILNLYGNPVFLIPGYRCFIIDSLPNLMILDEKVITKEERINSIDFKRFEGNDYSKIILNIHFLLNINIPCKIK
jgi:Leucine-rich repeat (LRR) protein